MAEADSYHFPRCGPRSWATTTSATFSRTRSQPRRLLSTAMLNSARSRRLSASSRRTRIVQTCVSGVPVTRPRRRGSSLRCTARYEILPCSDPNPGTTTLTAPRQRNRWGSDDAYRRASAGAAVSCSTRRYEDEVSTSLLLACEFVQTSRPSASPTPCRRCIIPNTPVHAASQRSAPIAFGGATRQLRAPELSALSCSGLRPHLLGQIDIARLGCAMVLSDALVERMLSGPSCLIRSEYPPQPPSGARVAATLAKGTGGAALLSPARNPRRWDARETPWGPRAR